MIFCICWQKLGWIFKPFQNIFRAHLEINVGCEFCKTHFSELDTRAGDIHTEIFKKITYLGSENPKVDFPMKTQNGFVR